MNLRWLWLNHVPAGITLSEAERPQLRKRVNQLRLKKTVAPESRRRHRREQVLLIAPLVLLFIGWSLWFSLTGTTGAWKAFFTVAGILVYNALLWTVIALTFYRTNAPYVRMALNEMGHPVCIECGYPLHGLTTESVCPECGAARWMPEASPTSAEAAA